MFILIKQMAFTNLVMTIILAVFIVALSMSVSGMRNEITINGYDKGVRDTEQRFNEVLQRFVPIGEAPVIEDSLGNHIPTDGNTYVFIP